MAKTIENDWVEAIAGDRRTYYEPFAVSGMNRPRIIDTSVVGSPFAVSAHAHADVSSSRPKRRGGGDCDDLLIVGAIALGMLD